MWVLYVWLTKVGGNCHTSEILKAFWQMGRTSSEETGEDCHISKFTEKACQIKLLDIKKKKKKPIKFLTCMVKYFWVVKIE